MITDGNLTSGMIEEKELALGHYHKLLTRIEEGEARDEIRRRIEMLGYDADTGVF